MGKGIIITVFLIAVGATLGATLRYYISVGCSMLFGLSFPYGTLLVNSIGCVILGCFLTLADERFPAIITPHHRILISTGFCGSLTTFSTFSYEAVELFQNGRSIMSAIYVSGSVVFGVIGIVLGTAVARFFFP